MLNRFNFAFLSAKSTIIPGKVKLEGTSGKIFCHYSGGASGLLIAGGKNPEVARNG
jgi:hypothetical protein